MEGTDGGRLQLLGSDMVMASVALVVLRLRRWVAWWFDYGDSYSTDCPECRLIWSSGKVLPTRNGGCCWRLREVLPARGVVVGGGSDS